MSPVLRRASSLGKHSTRPRRNGKPPRRWSTLNPKEIDRLFGTLYNQALDVVCELGLVVTLIKRVERLEALEPEFRRLVEMANAENLPGVNSLPMIALQAQVARIARRLRVNR